MSERSLRLQVVMQGVDKVTRPFKKIQTETKTLAATIKESRAQLKSLNAAAGEIDGYRKNASQLAVTKANLAAARIEAGKLAQQFANTKNPTAAQSKVLQQATQRVRELQRAENGLRVSLQQRRSALADAGVNTRKLSDAQKRLRAETEAATAAMDKQQQRMRRLSEKQNKINAIKESYHAANQRKAMIAGLGYTSMATGRRMIGGLSSALKVGYDFDAMMSQTQAVTRIKDKSNPEMMALRNQARTLPLQSKFTDLEVAQGQYFLGRTGYTAKQILGAMPGMLNLAAAGNVDLGTTADIASNIQTAMNLPAEKMDHVADVLTALFTRNNVDIPMLGESLKYSAGVGREYGQSLETVAAATAMLGSAGIQGSQAGTTMRSILSRIGTSKAVSGLGVKTSDENGNMRDMVDILKDINEKTKNLGNVERGKIFKDIAGQYAVTGFGRLMSAAGDGSLEKMRGKPGEYNGEAARVSGTMLNNMAGDMTMLHAAMENISVELFEKNNDWLRKFTQLLSQAMHWVAEFLKAHPAVSKALIVIGAVVGVATTAFGALMFAVIGILAPITLLRFQLSLLGVKGFSSLSLLTGGFKLLGAAILASGRLVMAHPIIAFIALIAAAGIYIWKNWDTLVPKFKALWDEIYRWTAQSWDNIHLYISQKWDEIVANVQSIPDKFKAAGSAIIDSLLGGINAKWDVLKTKLSSLTDYLPDFMKSDKATPLQKNVAAAMSNQKAMFAGMYDSGGTIGSGQFGIVGEYGPEIVQGPAVVTGRRQTAALLKNAPLHPHSLPASAYRSEQSPANINVTHAGSASAGAKYEVHIHAAAGQNTQEIANAVIRRLQEEERKKASRARSGFGDREAFA